MFYPVGVWQQPWWQVGLGLGWRPGAPRTALPGPQYHMLPIHPKPAEHREEGRDVGAGQERKRWHGGFKVGTPRCQHNKRERRNLHSSAWWGCAFLIYSVSSTPQRARHGEVGEELHLDKRQVAEVIFWAFRPQLNQAFMILWIFDTGVPSKIFSGKKKKRSAENRDSCSYWTLGIGSWAVTATDCTAELSPIGAGRATHSSASVVHFLFVQK